MTAQTFRDLLREKPFRPFRLVMSTGQAYEVRQPDLAFLTRSELVVGVGNIRDGIPARFKICSLLHVTAIESLEQAATDTEPTSV